MIVKQNIQIACYIVFDGFYDDFQNSFISASLQLVPLLSSKEICNRRMLFRENTVEILTILGQLLFYFLTIQFMLVVTFLKSQML